MRVGPFGVPTPIYNKWRKFLHSWFSDLIRVSGLQSSGPYILLVKDPQMILMEQPRVRGLRFPASQKLFYSRHTWVQHLLFLEHIGKKIFGGC